MPPRLEKLRRLMLVVALTLVVISVVTYALRARRAQQVRKAVPAVASDIQQQTQGFTFSRSEAGRTLFVLRAARTIERQGHKTSLEEVSVVVYGRQGDRADEIRTGRCEYVPAPEKIVCPDPVVLDLGGPLAQTHAEHEPRLHLETAGIQFDQATGMAYTAAPVTFRFPEGYGRAIGLRYQPQQPVLRLEREVELFLRRADGPTATLRGQSLEYDSRERLLRLRSPLRVALGNRQLEAGELVLRMDADYQIERLEAGAGVSARTQADSHRWELAADEAEATFEPGRGLNRLHASGNVEAVQRGVAQRTLRCRQLEIYFDSLQAVPRRVRASGEVRLRSSSTQEVTELVTDDLELWLRPGARSAEKLVTQARGILTFTQPSGEERQIEADRLEFHFDATGRLTTLVGQENVEIRWAVPGQPVTRTGSENLRASFDQEGKLLRAEQQGGFWFRQQGREARAGRAVIDPTVGRFVLTEHPSLTEGELRLSARQVELLRQERRLAAYGDVRTTYVGGADKRLFASALPVHIAAERMEGQGSRPEQPGGARYAGRVRLWQGANRMEADTVELWESPRRMLASGKVQSTFSELRETLDPAAVSVVQVASERFRYVETEQRGVYEDNVEGQAPFGHFRAGRVEVYLRESPSDREAKLDRVRAAGGIAIEQAGRQAAAENAEYVAENRSLTLWGGQPQIADPEYGTTEGARLTLNLADDTIRIESETGAQTVTRRTWTR